MPQKTFETILYATDFSESSLSAGTHARMLTELTGATLHILHVIGELSDQRRTMIHQEFFENFEKSVEREAIKDMHDFRKAHFRGLEKVECHTLIGNPFQEIMRQAEELGADLIVMGTHGRTGIEHVLVGSTAERVVRNSKIPVLTVRSGD
jgi:nucleotide-binding universal stress UspA family protein